MRDELRVDAGAVTEAETVVPPLLTPSPAATRETGTICDDRAGGAILRSGRLGPGDLQRGEEPAGREQACNPRWSRRSDTSRSSYRSDS
jgi:hypothetical protein